jgi:thioredoxin reductase
MVFHHLPERIRLDVVRRALGPSGGWFIRDKVAGKVPLSLGYTPEGCEAENGKVRLHLRGKDGSQRELVAEHVIAATGYRVSIDRLKFLNADIRASLKAVNDSPVLSSTFESSVPGLYFVGVSAANSFGPVMRFAFGAGSAARTVTRTMAKVLLRRPISVSVPLANPESESE